MSTLLRCARVAAGSGRRAGCQQRRYASEAAAAASATPAVEADSSFRFSPTDLKPRETVTVLDKHIVGQSDAKKAVSIALRNRWRRHKVPEDLRDEVSPKNILMIGPTGVGKTEISRRLAKITDAPFVKVEATKFTEVGYHGRDVDTIIDDLLKNAVAITKEKIRSKHQKEAREKAEDRVLEALAGKDEMDTFREHLREGGLDDMDVTIELAEKLPGPKMLFSESGEVYEVGNKDRRKTRMAKKKMKVSEALAAAEKEEMEKFLEHEDVEKEALRACEEDGIVVIDEIDKIVTTKDSYHGPQASAEGVQQDLLPLIEGSTVTTKKNVQVRTDRILFIASGAFHSCSPSDMLAELQGRLPIRVELQPLTEKDFLRILTEPKHNLVRQHIALMETEGVTLKFTEAAVQKIASISMEVNRSIQNIGARRLITVLERVMEDISFRAPELKGKVVTIDADYVAERVQELLKKSDLQKYLL